MTAAAAGRHRERHYQWPCESGNHGHRDGHRAVGRPGGDGHWHGLRLLATVTASGRRGRGSRLGVVTVMVTVPVQAWRLGPGPGIHFVALAAAAGSPPAAGPTRSHHGPCQCRALTAAAAAAALHRRRGPGGGLASHWHYRTSTTAGEPGYDGHRDGAASLTDFESRDRDYCDSQAKPSTPGHRHAGSPILDISKSGGNCLIIICNYSDYLKPWKIFDYYLPSI